MAAETFADKGWKPILEANPSAPYAFETYQDNGGVCKLGYGVTRNGETFASLDVTLIASAAESRESPGIAVRIIDSSSPPQELDYDDTAGDNDAVIVAPKGSGHVVAAMMLSAQGDLTAGTLLQFDTAGRVKKFVASAAAGDSIQAIRDDVHAIVGRLAEDCPESTSDPKKDVLCKVRLAV